MCYTSNLGVVLRIFFLEKFERKKKLICSLYWFSLRKSQLRYGNLKYNLRYKVKYCTAFSEHYLYVRPIYLFILRTTQTRPISLPDLSCAYFIIWIEFHIFRYLVWVLLISIPSLSSSYFRYLVRVLPISLPGWSSAHFVTGLSCAYFLT